MLNFTVGKILDVLMLHNQTAKAAAGYATELEA